MIFDNKRVPSILAHDNYPCKGRFQQIRTQNTSKDQITDTQGYLEYANTNKKVKKNKLEKRPNNNSKNRTCISYQLPQACGPNSAGTFCRQLHKLASFQGHNNNSNNKLNLWPNVGCEAKVAAGARFHCREPKQLKIFLKGERIKNLNVYIFLKVHTNTVNAFAF